MNFIVGQPLYEINGCLKSAPSPSSVFTVVTKCKQCGNQFASKVLPNTKPKNEFETIKLGDIFTNYSSQKSPIQLLSSDKNESDREDDLCSQCSTVHLVSSQTVVQDDYDPMTSHQYQDSSNNVAGSNNHGSTYTNGNGIIKVEIPESVSYLLTTIPGGPTSAPQTSVITSNHNVITHTGSNGVMAKKTDMQRSSVHLTSPLPVSVVLPNGLGNIVPTSSTNHIASHNDFIANGKSSSSSEESSPLVVKSELDSTNEIAMSTIRITSVTTGTHLVQNANGSSALSLACTLCNKNFKNEQFALAHNEKVHSKVARYTCPTCHGKFCYRGALNSHISFQHPQLASYNCTDCGKKFKEKSFLNAHHTIVHAENPRIFKCEFCPSAFSKKVNLNYHRKRKHPEQAAAAILAATNTQPTSSNTSTSTMNTHLHQSEQQRQFPGNNGVPLSGGYMFDSTKQEQQQSVEGYEMSTMTSSVVSIIDTIASNTEILPSGISKDSSQSGTTSGVESKKIPTSAQSKPEGDFKCQYCGRGFLFRNNLKCHLRTHIRDKKYTCEICEKSFIYKESLKNHMLLHSNELPYHCDICGKKFRDRSNRRKHVKNVHKFLLANGGAATGGSSSPANHSASGSGNVVQVASTSGAASTSPSKRKPRRPPAKKKDPLAITSPPPLSSSTPGPSPPPPKVGVIVSPKPTDYQSPHSFPITTQAQRQENLRFERDGIIVNVKSELSSPGSHESQQQQEYHHHHQQQQQQHHQHEQQLYLPPSMQHPNVIVYPKPKLENLTYASPPMGSPESHASHVHSVISSHPQHQYYESYSHQQQQHADTIPSYVSLMAPPQSISPETNTTGSGSYDSPASPYVINMSMLPPGARLRSNSTGINHPGSPSSQSQPQQQYSTPASTSLMYSSPMMGTAESVEGYHYWIPPAGHNQGTIRPYYNTADTIPITVTEGTLLNPQSSYVNTPSTSTHTPTTTPSTNYFYSELAQFDFSHL